ncbi:uncharacterized protein LOC133779563 [Humulus lupulus]|uniref:uncharacterized protein LOC133779563 n=1 Tax=Humulus lupulus TaxID=3486 RepID=UPI002B40BFAB|nr:uncharacterized protein LOC133779563 [Humulus lupulus]
MAETSKFHSALAITNVKTLIPITLDLESRQYHSWAALFKVQARVHNVLDHIIPPTDAKEKAAYDKAKAEDLPLWKRLDAAVLQWIYATFSFDILTSILIDDDSAEHAWHSVADLFHDNKNSRALYLNKAFTNTSLADFSTTNAYCNRLKSLADQLANVRAPVNDQSMILRMLQGLTEQYSNFVTVMQNKKSLPSFAIARSKLALEETTILERAKQESALVAHSQTSDDDMNHQNPSQGNSNHNNHHNNNNHRDKNGTNRKNNKNSGGRNSGKGGRNFGSGSAGGSGSGGGRGRHPQQWQPGSWMQWAPWICPPSPYPSYNNWARPTFTPRPPQHGLLGPKPQ